MSTTQVGTDVLGGGECSSANILGERREAQYDAVPRVTFTDPQAATVGVAI